MALAPCIPTLPSDSPVVVAWIASQVSALHKGAKLREIIRGRDAAGAFVRVVAWRAGGAPSLRIDGGEYGGDADFQGVAMPDAVRQALARRAAGATWEDPREARVPSAPGVWLHAAGRTMFLKGDTTLGDVAVRGLVWLVREDGDVCGASPELLDRARSGGAITWGPPPAAVGAEWVLASGLHRDELASPTWPVVLAALERWADAIAVFAAGAPQVSATVKVGDIVPAAEAARLPQGCVVDVQGSGEDGAVFHLRCDRVWWVKGRHGGASDHGGSRLLDFVNTWRPSSFRVLALGVPLDWSGASVRVVADVALRASAMSWWTVPEGHLARTTRGDVAWKRAGHAGRIMRGGGAGRLYTWGAQGEADDADFCEGLGSWTPLTGPHATPEEADEALRLLLEHGRLEPDPTAQAPQGEAPRMWKVGDVVHAPDEARTLPPGTILLEGEAATFRDHVAILPDRTALYLRRSAGHDIAAGTPRATAQGWAPEQVLECGPAKIVALADPARLGDGPYMRGLLGWPAPAQAAPAAAARAAAAGPDVRLMFVGPKGDPIEVKGLADGDFVTFDGTASGPAPAVLGPATVQITLDQGGAKALAAAFAPTGGPQPGDVVPWAQVPPSSLSLDRGGDPVWRLSDGQWRRLAFGLDQRWTEISSSLEPAAQQPLSGERCKIVRVGIPDDATLGDLVGWAAASKLAPDAVRAIERLPPEEQARASARAGEVEGAAVAVAAAARAPTVADRALARAREVLGDAFARRLAAPIASAWTVGNERAGWHETTRLEVVDGRARMRADCSCIMCQALPKAAWTDLPPAGPERPMELVRLMTGVPSVAGRLAPWGTVQAVLAASPGVVRPRAWPALQSASAEGVPLLLALAGKRRDGGTRWTAVGALRLDEVEPWTWEARVAIDGAETCRLAPLTGRRVFALSAADALGVLAEGTPFAATANDAAAQRATVLSLAQWDAAVDSDAFVDWWRAGHSGPGASRAYVVAGGEALLALPAGGWLRVASRGTGLVVVHQGDPAPGAATQAATHAARVVRQQARKCAAWEVASGARLSYIVAARDGTVLASSGAGPRVIE